MNFQSTYHEVLNTLIPDRKDTDTVDMWRSVAIKISYIVLGMMLNKQITKEEIKELLKENI